MKKRIGRASAVAVACYAAGAAGGGGGSGSFCPPEGVTVDGDHADDGIVSIVPVVTVEPKFTG